MACHSRTLRFGIKTQLTDTGPNSFKVKVQSGAQAILTTPEQLYCRMTLGSSTLKPGRHLTPASQGHNSEAIGCAPSTEASQRRHSQK